jgi:hypothetical protein
LDTVGSTGIAWVSFSGRRIKARMERPPSRTALGPWNSEYFLGTGKPIESKMASLNGKSFKTHSNSSNGEVNSGTIFHYFENEGVVWADYSGGSIIKGQLIGVKTSDETLDFRYSHVSQDYSIKTGICKSAISIESDGKLRLKEKWKWTCGDESEGESEILEV